MTYQTNDIVAARTYGLAFISTFLAYGVGTALLDGMFTAPDPIAVIEAGSTIFVSSIILTVIVHTIANMTLAVIMFKILQPFCRFLHVAYLAFANIATTALLVGGAMLALALPLSGNQTFGPEQTIEHVALLHKGNFYLYQAGMTIWGVGGFLMCIVLLRTKLVPTWLPVWGMVGYCVFVIGTVSEFYGSGFGVTLSLPGGLFELALSLWLIIKGFDYSHVNAKSTA